MHLFRTFGQQSPIKVAVKLVVSKEKQFCRGYPEEHGEGGKEVHTTKSYPHILPLNLTPTP